MTLTEAYRVLRRYEDFRLGFDERNVADVFPEQEHSQAIRLILASQCLDRPLVNCAKCKHQGVGSACKLHVRGECTKFEEVDG